MVRKTIAVIIGYLFFAGSSALLFYLSEVEPEKSANNSTMLFIGVAGGILAIISGYLSARISKSSDKKVIGILSLVMVIGAVISVIATPDVSHWTQIMVILILAPLSYFGGLITMKKANMSRA